LAEVALDQVDHLSGHGLHGNLDVHDIGAAVRLHAVWDQVALGEGFKQTGQQAGEWVGVQHETDGDG
jgi:hypothetical protein